MAIFHERRQHGAPEDGVATTSEKGKAREIQVGAPKSFNQ